LVAPCWTQVHRRDQLEAGRVHGPALGTRNADDAVLERLAQGFERRADELRQLVQEQDAPVRQAHLARPRVATTPDDRRHRRTVVRRPERRIADERTLGRQQPRDGVDPGYLQRLVRAERGQESRQPPREHRLAGSRRPGEQEVVAAGATD